MTEQGELFPELLPAGAVAAPQHEAPRAPTTRREPSFSRWRSFA